MVRAILEERKTQTRRIVKVPLNDPNFGCELGASELGGLDLNLLCPHGAKGDRLWVKETFAYHLCCGRDTESVHYRADGESCPNDGETIRCSSRWRPSIFMPRSLSRITLEVAAVRVERLREITEADAIAEGANSAKLFRHLWDSLNAKRGFGWDKNPWVWVLTFKRV